MTDSTPPSMEDVQKKKEEWAEGRRAVIDRLRAIAAEKILLDGWHVGDHAATFAGSSVGGLASNPLIVTGLLMPLPGAGGKIGFSVAKMNVVKGLAAEVQRLCEEDANRLSTFIQGAEALLAARAAVGAAAEAMNALKASISVLRHTVITVPNAAGRTSLKALLPALAGVTAGIREPFDVVSLISSASTFANIPRNESDQMATKIREIAHTLQKELHNALAPPPPPKDDQQ